MSTWFGKECEYLCCQWEDNEATGGPNYKESTPTLFYCSHEKNKEDNEGNCRIELCPLIINSTDRKFEMFCCFIVALVLGWVIGTIQATYQYRSQESTSYQEGIKNGAPLAMKNVFFQAQGKNHNFIIKDYRVEVVPRDDGRVTLRLMEVEK